MKAWYSKVSIRATYVVTFETDNAELKREVEKYLQGIMDKDEPQTEDEILHEQVRAFMGIVEQTEREE